MKEIKNKAPRSAEPCHNLKKMVGDRRIELLTSSVSRLTYRLYFAPN